jgi:hypothetical protein
MCYRVRDTDRQGEGAAAEPRSPGSTFIGPRVAGAIAAALVAVVAVAAMLMPASTPAVSADKAAAPAAVSDVTLAKVAASERAGVAIEQTSTALDDGVPSSSTEVAHPVRSGHCDH